MPASMYQAQDILSCFVPMSYGSPVTCTSTRKSALHMQSVAGYDELQDMQ